MEGRYEDVRIDLPRPGQLVKVLARLDNVWLESDPVPSSPSPSIGIYATLYFTIFILNCFF
jgi:hypothetical protein